MRVTDVGNHGEVHRCRIQRASGGGSAHPATAAAAGVLRNAAGFIGGATGVTLQNRLGQGGHKFTVILLAGERRATAGSGALGCVGGAFVLGFGQGFFGHQQTLTLVPFARPVESHHHRRERTVLARPPRQGRVPGGQEHQLRPGRRT